MENKNTTVNEFYVENKDKTTVSKSYVESKNKITTVNKFYKISLSRAKKDNENLAKNWNDIKLPKRATKHSAGYDFYIPFNVNIEPGQTTKIPTGIRIKLDDDKVLLVFPRSSLGFKYKLKIDNTVGVIDSDYFNSDNEGHIWISMTNMGDKAVNLKKGDAFCQGIILSFYTTEDDNTTEERNGGIGSTDKKRS